MLLSDPEQYDSEDVNPGGEDEGDDGGHIGDDGASHLQQKNLKALCRASHLACS